MRSLKRENELALHQTDMRMIRCMWYEIKDRMSCIELRQQLGNRRHSKSGTKK